MIRYHAILYKSLTICSKKAVLVAWAHKLKRSIPAIWIAARDPRTRPAAKIIALFTAAYALSPIDLIPDLIPVIGYIDDLIIVPLGITTVVRMIPSDLMTEYTSKADDIEIRPVSYIAATVIILLWILVALGCFSYFN